MVWMVTYGDDKPVARVSDNFYVSEVEFSDTAVRNSINNRASEWVLDNARRVATHCAEPIRAKFGAFRPNSWYRCEELEKAITWDSGFRSWCARHARIWCERPDIIGISAWPEYFALKSHPNGQAIDLEVPGTDNDDLYFWCKANLEFDQLIREFPKPNDPLSGWVHVSYTKDGNRQQAFSIPSYDKYYK